LLVPSAPSAAGDAPLDRATLRGLKAVNVVLDQLDPEVEKQGLTRTDLQARLEARLKDGQIPLDPSAPDFVGLRVTSVRAGRGALALRGAFALCITLAVYQPVALSRDQHVRTAAATWDVESVLMADPKAIRQASMDTVDELVGRLASAWREVNPR